MPDTRDPVPQISVNCLRISSQPPTQPNHKSKNQEFST